MKIIFYFLQKKLNDNRVKMCTYNYLNIKINLYSYIKNKLK